MGMQRLLGKRNLLGKRMLLAIFIMALAGCVGNLQTSQVTEKPTATIFTTATTLPTTTATSAPPSPTATRVPGATPLPNPTFTPTLIPLVPNFSHIVMILLENREFGLVIGNPQMPNFNRWAVEHSLLTQHYALLHPSLPNYIALMGGDTFGIDRTCNDCFIDAPSLPDLIEASGRTWKGYMEDMPSPCFLGDTHIYVQKHNPFIYFDAIRLDEERCQQHVVPLEQLYDDLSAGELPDFIFITPNQCSNSHDCPVNIADLWLGNLVPYLLAYPGIAQEGLVILTWDEGQGDHGCCGFEPGGGRIATILISPYARAGFQDDTQYTHYSLLKTIAAAWSLPELGYAADESTQLIKAPWDR